MDQFLQLCREYAMDVGLDRATATLSTQKNVMSAVDSCGRNVMHLAAWEGHCNIAALLVRIPLLVDAVDRDRWTPLHHAAYGGHEEIVELIIAQNPELVNATDGFGKTALHVAAEQGHGDIITRLLAHCSIENPTSQGETVLHLAASGGHDKLVGDLLAKSPQLIDAIDRHGQLAIHRAVVYGHEHVMARMIAQKPELIDSVVTSSGGYAGWTLLHLAIGELDSVNLVARLLHEHPKLINSVTKRGKTALHLAAQSGNEDIVAQLLACNPSLVDVVDSGGMTALHFACSTGNESIVAQLLAERPKLMQGPPEPNEYSILHYAAEHGHAEVMAQLLAANLALIRARDRRGWSALQCAIASGSQEVVTMLLALQPELSDGVDMEGENSLMIAVKQNEVAIAAQLLEANPELIHEVDPQGSTPLHVALEFIFGDALENQAFIKNVWERKMSALHTVNELEQTPFHCAVANRTEWAVQFFKWKMTFDEFVSAFSGDTKSCEKIRPFLDSECEALRVQFLNVDLVGVVFEFLGYGRGKTAQRKGKHSSPQQQLNTSKKLRR